MFRWPDTGSVCAILVIATTAATVTFRVWKRRQGEEEKEKEEEEELESSSAVCFLLGLAVCVMMVC